MRAYIHNGRDWSTRHWPIALTASVMPFKSGIIDGEVVALDDQHRSCFNVGIDMPQQARGANTLHSIKSGR